MDRISREKPRGCGHRKVGGLYMVSGDLTQACQKLPFLLSVCPVCGCGVKPARGWTWIRPRELFGLGECDLRVCEECPAGPGAPQKAGLIWVGESFYRSTEHFLIEAAEMGVSRRINAVPRGFRPGEDWVFLAHRKAVPQIHDERRRGVFAMFRPTLEKVVSPDVSAEEIAKLARRGIDAVVVERLSVNGELL